MDEPPAKRAKRPDSAAMWDKNDNIASPKSPRPQGRERDVKDRSRREDDRNGSQNIKREENRRRKSRSVDRHERRRNRSASKERLPRDSDATTRVGGRDRDDGGRSRREKIRSRSRDRYKSSKYSQESRREREHRRSRSRSPIRNGVGSSARTRSPLRHSQTGNDQIRSRDKIKTEAGDKDRKIKREDEDNRDVAKPSVNGSAMDMDEDEEIALMQKMMGFSTFKSTQNTKVPGNQIYGVRKEKKTEYRQYMNRVGGFNRPLSPSR